MTTPNLKLEQIDTGITRLTLSQPAKRNALNAQMWADLPKVLKDAEGMGTKVLIVQGDGDHFASGADISEFGTLYATPDSAAAISKDIAAGLEALARFPRPTLAQVRGACVGGGCGLAICCDLRFADTSAKMAITPAKLGLVYPYADVQRLIHTVGLSTAKDILFSARLFNAEAAKAVGLIDHLHSPEDLEEATLAYARTVASLSGETARISKAMFTAFQDGQTGENPDSLQLFLEGFNSDDFKEGYKAFTEKRKPQFK